MTVKIFLVGLPAMLLCLVVQTMVTFWCVRYYARQSTQPGARRGFRTAIRPLAVTMIVMMVGNLFQIWLWGMLFMLIGEFGELYEAVYHSAVNFSSLGYGDVVMGKDWKLLGPLEAVNGVLMLGMTAAALMAIMQNMIKTQQDAMLGAGGKRD
jgi:hypothetical protein